MKLGHKILHILGNQVSMNQGPVSSLRWDTKGMPCGLVIWARDKTRDVTAGQIIIKVS